MKSRQNAQLTSKLHQLHLIIIIITLLLFRIYNGNSLLLDISWILKYSQVQIGTELLSKNNSSGIVMLAAKWNVAAVLC